MRTTVFAKLLCASLVCAPASAPLAASAVAIVPAPQPPGVGCVAVKIVSGAAIWAAINCTNNRAYLIKNKAVLIPLALPAGMASETASDVDMRGDVVGYAQAPGVTHAFEWNAAGIPALLPGPASDVAFGIDQFTSPIVGFGVNGAGGGQGFWFKPGPGWINPSPALSIAYDVNKAGINVGLVNGIAGAGPAKVLNPIPGAAPGAIAYAINEHNLIVGHQDLSGPCGGRRVGEGFLFPFPGGPIAPVPPLPGDCTAGGDDLNDAGAVVGYSSPGVPALQQALGFKLPAPFPPGLVNLNTFVPHPWVRLTDAPGIDDTNDVIATDGGAAPTRVYFIN